MTYKVKMNLLLLKKLQMKSKKDDKIYYVLTFYNYDGDGLEKVFVKKEIFDKYEEKRSYDVDLSISFNQDGKKSVYLN